jgi:hypothetical protein
MIVTFKSAASADVIYFGDVAKRDGIDGRGCHQGIVTVEQLPAAIAALRPPSPQIRNAIASTCWTRSKRPKLRRMATRAPSSA